MKRSHRLIDDWQARIAGLERLRQTAPEWNWLWDIRLKVLRFLRARYADRDIAQRPPVTATAEVEGAPFQYPPHDPERDAPRMSREEMREILEEIHEIAQCSPLAEFDDVFIDPPQRT